MYLKEGDIGKAESEEIIPVKTETEILSHAGSADRSQVLPGSCLMGYEDWVLTAEGSWWADPH